MRRWTAGNWSRRSCRRASRCNAPVLWTDASWRGERILLKGACASRDGLAEQLRRNPAVVHLATHVLESSERPSYGLIALDRKSTRLNSSHLAIPYAVS